MTCQSHLTPLFLMMMRRTQHEVLHIMLTFLIGHVQNPPPSSELSAPSKVLEKEELDVRPKLVRDIPEAGCRAQSHNIPTDPPLPSKAPTPSAEPLRKQQSLRRQHCTSPADRHECIAFQMHNTPSDVVWESATSPAIRRLGKDQVCTLMQCFQHGSIICNHS